MMSLYLKYLVYTLLILFISCEKEGIGELSSNLSCTMNGEHFYPEKLNKSLFYIQITDLEEIGSYGLEIYALNNNDRYKRLRIWMAKPEPIIEGVYNFGSLPFNGDWNDYLSANCYFEKTGNSAIKTPQESSFNTAEELEGTLTIAKIDTLNQNITGNFYFQAINKNTGEIIKVKDGKFDTRLYLVK